MYASTRFNAKFDLFREVPVTPIFIVAQWLGLLGGKRAVTEACIRVQLHLGKLSHTKRSRVTVGEDNIYVLNLFFNKSFC